VRPLSKLFQYISLSISQDTRFTSPGIDFLFIFHERHRNGPNAFFIVPQSLSSRQYRVIVLFTLQDTHQDLPLNELSTKDLCKEDSPETASKLEVFADGLVIVRCCVSSATDGYIILPNGSDE
jgi:hypothetical protein